MDLLMKIELKDIAGWSSGPSFMLAVSIALCFGLKVFPENTILVETENSLSGAAPLLFFNIISVVYMLMLLFKDNNFAQYDTYLKNILGNMFGLVFSILAFYLFNGDKQEDEAIIVYVATIFFWPLLIFAINSDFDGYRDNICWINSPKRLLFAIPVYFALSFFLLWLCYPLL